MGVNRGCGAITKGLCPMGHARTPAYTQLHTYLRAHTCVHIPAHPHCEHTPVHTCLQTRTCMHTPAHTHLCTHTCASDLDIADQHHTFGPASASPASAGIRGALSSIGIPTAPGLAPSQPSLRSLLLLLRLVFLGGKSRPSWGPEGTGFPTRLDTHHSCLPHPRRAEQVRPAGRQPVLHPPLPWAQSPAPDPQSAL